jgi:hypothetical protein
MPACSHHWRSTQPMQVWYNWPNGTANGPFMKGPAFAGTTRFN